MKVLKIISLVTTVIVISMTMAHMARHPKATLGDSIPLVNVYKDMLTRQMKAVEKISDSPDGEQTDSSNGGTSSTSKSGHFTHDKSGQSVDSSGGIENSGENPLSRGPYKDSDRHH